MSRVLCVALALAGLAVADPVMAQRGSGKPVVAVTEFRNESVRHGGAAASAGNLPAC